MYAGLRTFSGKAKYHLIMCERNEIKQKSAAPNGILAYIVRVARGATRATRRKSRGSNRLETKRSETPPTLQRAPHLPPQQAESTLLFSPTHPSSSGNTRLPPRLRNKNSHFTDPSKKSSAHSIAAPNTSAP